MIVRERQHHALRAAADACRRTGEALADGLPSELAAVDLQDAMDALQELVGESSIEQVLDHLFATFCIGK